MEIGDCLGRICHGERHVDRVEREAVPVEVELPAEAREANLAPGLVPFKD